VREAQGANRAALLTGENSIFRKSEKQQGLKALSLSALVFELLPDQQYRLIKT
jgi:hypothetical protein